uniref:Reverse transcriptase domain-containing protein n=1 Tax=Meloidogyne hapla TaxID=6305 RepID=A0A1I8BVZ0_MELHA
MATKTEIQQILSKLNSIEQRISKIETAQAQTATTASSIDSSGDVAAVLTKMGELEKKLIGLENLILNNNNKDEEDPAHAMERQRSLVLIGVPENAEITATAKNKADRQLVEKLFDRLGVETEAIVYRLGKIPTPSGGPRLVKCVLPASTLQRFALRQWKFKRSEIRSMPNFNRLIIRPSLTRAQLEMEKEQREMNKKLKEAQMNPQVSIQRKYNFRKANYSHINQILANTDWIIFFYDCPDVESSYNKFIYFLHTIIESLVPLIKQTDSIKNLPVHIQRLYQYRKNLWKAITKEHIRKKFLETSKKFELEISKFIRNRENKKLFNIKTKFDYVSSFIKSKNSKIPSLIGQNNQFIFSNQIKSDILADQFSSVFSDQNISSQFLSFSHQYPTTKIDSIFIDPQIVFNTMAKLDNSNNSSPDGIPNIFYNKCRDTLVIPLTHIFSLSILSSKIPTIWKKAIINPIPKKSNPKYPIDFRPISLLCSSSKILEKIIANELQSFIEANNILPNCQHGFRKSHSVSTQLLEVMDDFTYSLENKCLIDVIYFDLAKAFDTVPHSLLISKLNNIGIQG